MDQTTTQQQPPSYLPKLPAYIAELLVGQLLIVLSVMTALVWKLWVVPAISRGKLQLRLTVTQDLEIRAVLSQILELCQADRALLSQFHNGEIYSSGRHYMKLSVTHEVTQPGIGSIARQSQGIPVSRLAQELSILQDGTLFQRHRSTVTEEGCREHLVTTGVWYLAEQLLLSDDTALGILTVQYCTDPVPAAKGHPILSDYQVERLQDLRRRLVYLLRRRSKGGEMMEAIDGRK